MSRKREATSEPPLRAVSLALGEDASPDSFPFSIPALRELGTLDLAQPVTFLVGENGSGKSTFIEALAWAIQAVSVGSEPLDQDPTLEHVRPLGRALRPVWNSRARRGFFLRAEDFFGFVKRTNRSRAELEDQALRVRAERPELPQGELDRIASPFEGSARALADRYGEDLDARSHGEQFLAFFMSRLVPGGLYLLDEPEVPLSPSRQLTLLSILKSEVETRPPSQFVIATHSPILMALPGSRILSFDETPIREVAYEDLEHVRLTRDFLNRPERFLRHL
jgi:predicted ATPase